MESPLAAIGAGNNGAGNDADADAEETEEDVALDRENDVAVETEDEDELEAVPGVVDGADEEDRVLIPRTAAIVIAPEVPQHAVLFAPQHHVVEEDHYRTG